MRFPTHRVNAEKQLSLKTPENPKPFQCAQIFIAVSRKTQSPSPKKIARKSNWNLEKTAEWGMAGGASKS